MYEFGELELQHARGEIDGLTSADLFGGADEAHVLIHLFRKGDSRCALLFDGVIQNIINLGYGYWVTIVINENLHLEFFYDENCDAVWMHGYSRDVEMPTTSESQLPGELHNILDACV